MKISGVPKSGGPLIFPSPFFFEHLGLDGGVGLDLGITSRTEGSSTITVGGLVKELFSRAPYRSSGLGCSFYGSKVIR